jgi:DNA-binding LacI/PurR family transcriptional regulator
MVDPESGLDSFASLQLTEPMTSESKPHGIARVTTRLVAAHAGVSSTTVSLALRGNPRIPAETRARVQRIADELGYRPDPQLAKLMYRLRNGQAPGFQSTIAALTTIPESAELPYLHNVISGARRRAEMLGYAFTAIRVPDTSGRRPGLQRMLRSRGVEGILILPLLTPRPMDDLLDWGGFSVVAATYGLLSPEFHRVVPHQFGDMLLLCESLARLGYRRLGLVLPKRHDLTVHHGSSAGLAWQNAFGDTEPVAPLIHDTDIPADISRWFKRERPDVIIASGARECQKIAGQLGLIVPGRIGFSVTNRDEGTPIAGIEERPAEIGKTAIDLLHTKIVTGEKGVPAVAMAAMILGCWIPGPSAAGRLKPALHQA